MTAIAESTFVATAGEPIAPGGAAGGSRGSTRTANRPLRLQSFSAPHAVAVCDWTLTAQELWWLAPNTAPPLSRAKIEAWKKERGSAYVFAGADGSSPLAYGELNPMQNCPDHFWIGHFVVRPDQRGQGLGRRFLELLLIESFERRAAGRVSLIVFPDNAMAIRCYCGAGFGIVGEEHHQFRGQGPRHRLLRLSMMRSEFRDRPHSGRGRRPADFRALTK